MGREQPRAEFRLEALERERQCRLGDAEAIGGERHRAGLHHREEIAQVLQIHWNSL
jgi:hypothetical protein